MKRRIVFVILISFYAVINVAGQAVDFKKEQVEAIGVRMSLERIDSKIAVKVIKDSTVREPDEPTYVKLVRSRFKDGIIEVNVLSRLLPDAPADARGFIGLAFRINPDNSKFESIYIRPTNGRADDQVRRNHSIQYFSYPDFKFSRLRKESPEKYESHADMGLNEWIKLRIVVKGVQAKLYLNENAEPSLIVNDLKLGSGIEGGIGLFVDVGTEGYFTDLKITRQ